MRSVDQRLSELSSQVENLTSVTNCLASDQDQAVIKNTLRGQISDVAAIASSVLKSSPRVLFRHDGPETFHLNSVGSRFLIARAGVGKAEIRSQESG